MGWEGNQWKEWGIEVKVKNKIGDTIRTYVGFLGGNEFSIQIYINSLLCQRRGINDLPKFYRPSMVMNPTKSAL